MYGRCSRYAPNNLRDEYDDSAENRHGSDTTHSQSYSWIEKSSTYPEEDPDIDGKAEAECKTDEQKLAGIGSKILADILPGLRGIIDTVKSTLAEEHEEESSSKFANKGHGVTLDPSW